jgi:glycosyltransferase involved in cell wall biosynthesis
MEECVSVIMPIYKVEPYLRRAVDSVCCQTYSNLEIILVDDGSPDGCGNICDEYAKADSRRLY